MRKMRQTAAETGTLLGRGTHALLVLGVFLSLGFMVFGSVRASAEPTPVAAFARLPEYSSVKLSPDGRRLLALREVAGKRRLFVRDLEGAPGAGSERILDMPPLADADINWASWANDERLLVSLREFVSRRGQVAMKTRLLAINHDGAQPLFLLESNPRLRRLSVHDRVINNLPLEPHHVLLAIDLKRNGWPAVYKINIETGSRERIQTSRRNIRYWDTDADGNVRIGYGRRGKYRFVIAREAPDSSWRTIWKGKLREGPSFTPVSMGPDSSEFFFLSDKGTGREALYRMDVAGDLSRELVFAHPKVDVLGIIFGMRETQVAGVHYAVHRIEAAYFDPNYRSLQDAISRHLAKRPFHILGTSKKLERAIVLTLSDKDPGTFHLYDRARDRLTKLFERYPEIDRAELSKSRAVNYTARDGVEIPGYVTLPRGFEDAKRPIPFVVFPHGGPHTRDYTGFDYFVSLFTNRGYGVLRMNFRGSSGYGTKFRRAGYGEWGGKMQDDVTDGALWLIQNGYADPKRLCIVGASYGGFVAMMGLVKTPELFTCGASLNGVSDAGAYLRDEWGLSGDRARTAHIGRNPAALSRLSPLNNVKKISAPLFIAHGALDNIVNPKQSYQMAEALRAAGKDLEALWLPEGDHWLLDGGSRLTLVTALEKFLNEHLGDKKPEFAGRTEDDSG